MKTLGTILGGVILASALFIAAGCSPSPSSEPSAKIDGMSPAEYREKAEMSRQIAAPGKARARPGR